MVLQPTQRTVCLSKKPVARNPLSLGDSVYADLHMVTASIRGGLSMEEFHLCLCGVVQNSIRKHGDVQTSIALSARQKEKVLFRMFSKVNQNDTACVEAHPVK